MYRSANLNFVRQQGMGETDAADCACRFPALMLQPRLVGIAVIAGLVLQSWALFLCLAVILWFNVLFPSLNPFDALYNRFIAGPKGRPRLTPAPAPRRFAQGMAGSFMLAIGICLLSDWQTAALVFEGLLVAAFAALILGKFCLGSYIYHLLRGEVDFANRTLPWAGDDRKRGKGT